MRQSNKVEGRIWQVPNPASIFIQVSLWLEKLDHTWNLFVDLDHYHMGWMSFEKKIESQKKSDKDPFEISNQIWYLNAGFCFCLQSSRGDEGRDGGWRWGSPSATQNRWAILFFHLLSAFQLNAGNLSASKSPQLLKAQVLFTPPTSRVKQSGFVSQSGAATKTQTEPQISEPQPQPYNHIAIAHESMRRDVLSWLRALSSYNLISDSVTWLSCCCQFFFLSLFLLLLLYLHRAPCYLYIQASTE